ncbi:hypothetical protein Zmor_026958 [Zophobas morio]|uniref:Uncharacterized protein n=1 Tax=Zophobas morio TaxID=2755281 RepID=A0AA38HY07_9CUCU|nr:hypothetical protein Zmor_026958 [Zophobas morio]
MKEPVARLLNLTHVEALKLYNTLKGSKKEDIIVTEILEELEKYWIPKKNEIMPHYNFFNRKQKEYKNFYTFVTSLRELVVDYEFGDLEEKIIKTRIILGIYSAPFLKVAIGIPMLNFIPHVNLCLSKVSELKFLQDVM